MPEQAEVLLIAAACAASAGALAIVLLWRARGRSMRGALVSVSLVSVLAVVAGVAGAAKAMFISPHDLGVVVPVSLAAGTVSLVLALLLAQVVVRDVDRVRDTARRLEDVPDDHEEPGPSASISELEDIRTELVRARDRLAAARRRERDLETSRRELVAWVSHDLRTPLTGLRAMAEALEDGLADDPSRYHQQIRREVDRLAGMVDDLFELSRIEAGTLRLSVETVDVRELVDDVLAGSRPAAERCGVHLGVDLEVGERPAVVRGDTGGLARVLANLVVNAVRHTPSDGTVRVTGRAEASTYVFGVGDGCGGLTHEELDRVFDAGWRGTSARTPSPDEGAGLGLAIARGIVEAHDGRILARNSGGGCLFEVHLPADRLTAGGP